MELFEHPLHIVVQLAVFAVLHKRGSEGSRVFAVSDMLLFTFASFCEWLGVPHRFLMIPCPPGKMTASKLLASSVDRSCICIFPWPWLKRADSIIMFLFDGQHTVRSTTLQNVSSQTHLVSPCGSYRFSPEAGCFFMWSITCICCWLGANIWKRAPFRLRWYMVLRRRVSVRWCVCANKVWKCWCLNTHYTPSWMSVPSHHPHPEKTWSASMHTMTTLPTIITFLSLTTYRRGNLPLQCWCSPSCHSHLGERSRPAGEKERPEFSLKAKSWSPAWFCLSLAVLGVCESLWRLLTEQTLISLSMSAYIPPEHGQVTLPHKLHCLVTSWLIPFLNTLP